ncbi:Glycoside hydrolase family 92 protein [Mycena kentingensis (nom. inval.)]|nr:Glycoside hydrolase family 92 protein [Mycena kentingensis (nom. inval.)]
MAHFLATVGLLLLSRDFVDAQPAPSVQAGITAAIKAAANATGPLDLTQFVNVYVGTDNFGDVCPGASIPFGMVKFSTDLTGYAPAGPSVSHTSKSPYLSTLAGYVTDPTQFIRGLSPMHDSGTGSSLGTYGNFEIMPLLCPNGFDTCTTRLADRQRLRKLHTDVASPGYFAQTLDNNILMEATATRRAGLERFTFGPGRFNYKAFACYDLLNGGSQTLDEYGVWTADNFGLDIDAKGLGQTHLNLTLNLIGGVYQSGALFSFANNPKTVVLRVGISFVSTDQACANAESEVGGASFDDVHAQAKALWNDKLGRVEIDVPNTPPNVTELLYTSLYRAALTPNNATGETQGLFAGTSSFYFDSLYCSWDTFRTFYPLLSLHAPVEYAQIVDSYIDGWRKNGWMPECRANNLPGWTQGGSSADVIVAHFATHYHNEAAALGINLDELYAAAWTDAEVTPPEWNIQGRQAAVYNQFGYVPFAGAFYVSMARDLVDHRIVLDTASTGRQTREGSRTLEYAFEDFAIRQIALLLGKTDDEALFANRSMNYRNVWDPTVVSDGFKGFSQKRYSNGKFNFTNPKHCSPVDSTTTECSLQSDNLNGFYESSSWEYSWFAPHDTAHLIELMGGNDFKDTFVKRLNHFFSAGYYGAGNEPSFQTPIGYHYANHPALSVDRVRNVVFENFDITAAGLPGNDDQAAMASLLVFHLLGLYPVPSTTQYLILSPFLPKYTIHNPYLGVSTTIEVINFNPRSVQHTIPAAVPAYVANVTINGAPAASRCHFDFYDVFRVGGTVTIELTADKAAADDCLGGLPESLSTGGFASVR